MKRIPDHEAMKLTNQLTLLRMIREGGPASRAGLQQQSGLSWGTVTTAVKELLERGILREAGSVPTAMGRRPVEVDLDTGTNFAVGLQLASAAVRAVLVDIRGTVIGVHNVQLDPGGSRERITGTLVAAARTLLTRHGVGAGRLAGIGVAAPGAVDFASGVCRSAPHHPRWKDVPLGRILAERFHVPCFVDRVCNCFALNELLFGAGRGLASFLCVLVGTGLGAGIVLDGSIYRGADGLAGEFGHTCVEAGGPACDCGSRGCLELYASGRALSRMAAEAASARPRGRIAALAAEADGELGGEVLCRAAEEGDAQALEIFRRLGSSLGIGVANLVTLLNPGRIIIGGRVTGAGSFFLPALEQTVARQAWRASRQDIRISEVERGAVHGAAALVFQETFATGEIVRRRGRGRRRGAKE